MKKSYKKILLAVMVIVLTFGMTACGNGGSGSAENTSSDGDSAFKSLTVGISASPKPFNYQDENGELTGLEVDMLKHIAEKTISISISRLRNSNRCSSVWTRAVMT